MAGWKCFMVEPSEFCRRSLRRYGAAIGKSCPTTFPGSLSYHNAEVVIDERFPSPGDSGQSFLQGTYEGDPRWPTVCLCGYAFGPDDSWQVNEHRLYRGAPEGALYTLRDMPPGAIWRCDWLEGLADNPDAGPDGKVWALMLPGGLEWLIYGPSSDQPPIKWTVEGTLPEITVSPSINQEGSYHGHVKGGIITPDCEGRPLPKHPQTA